MTCDNCQQECESVLRCNCFAVLCQACFDSHECEGKPLATVVTAFAPVRQTVEEQEPKITTEYGTFSLRDYQKDALKAIIQELT